MADVDIEALGLLDGLEGEAREERAQLIAWLLDRGFSIEHIRASVAAPLMLPAYRVLMVWVYDRTGSLLVAILMHASLTATITRMDVRRGGRSFGR